MLCKCDMNKGATHMNLILFDCDGTLVDSQDIIVTAMNQVFADHGLKRPSREDVLGIVGLSLTEAISRLSPESDSRSIEVIGAAYRAAYQELRFEANHVEPLFYGAKTALKHLVRRDNICLGIATGKSRRGVRAVFERHKISDYFVTIQTADDAPSKPHPGMIEKALEETGAYPEDAIMIGDTTYDILMAHNAGVKAIGVSWGYHSVDDLRDAGAYSIAHNFPALLRLISGVTEKIEAVA